MTQASVVKALLRDSSISCIHSYIWEYVAMRKSLLKVHICKIKRLSIAFPLASFLNVYGDECHFVDEILLERPGNKIPFYFLYLIPNANPHTDPQIPLSCS